MNTTHTHEYYEVVKRVGINATVNPRGQKYITIVHAVDAGRDPVRLHRYHRSNKAQRPRRGRGADHALA